MILPLLLLLLLLLLSSPVPTVDTLLKGCVEGNVVAVGAVGAFVPLWFDEPGPGTCALV